MVNPARSYFDPLGPDYVQHLVPMLKQYEAVGMQDPTVGFHSVTAGRQGLIAGQRFGDDVTHIVAAPPPERAQPQPCTTSRVLPSRSRNQNIGGTGPPKRLT